MRASCGHETAVPVRVHGRDLCHECAVAATRATPVYVPAPGFGPDVLALAGHVPAREHGPERS